MLRSAIHVQTARPEHAAQIIDVLWSAYDSTGEDVQCDECMTPENVRNHIAQFPEGQFVALHGDRVVGFALTMRTHRSPQTEALPWLEAIGDLNVCNHEPEGEWLYGIDFAVDRTYRKRGIGTKLYKARFGLVKQLTLKGFYAGGMLAGYPKYSRLMSVREYAKRIIHGEIKDPTVTMQINRGFKPKALIEQYTSDPEPYNNAMLIVWDNPQYHMTPA